MATRSRSPRACVAVRGGGARERLVVVDLGDYRRAIRTGGRMIRAAPGIAVCVAQRWYLLRRWVGHRLVLPGYCRGGGPGALVSVGPAP